MFENTLKNAIINAWPMLTIFLVVVIVMRLTSFRTSGKKFILHDEIMNLFFIVYILLLFELLTGTENSLGSGFNIKPFTEIMRYEIGSKQFIYNVIGNILIFVPFGYFVARYIKAKNYLQILINSIITSATVELVQLKIGRSFDIDDIILNVIGGTLGYLVYVALEAIRTHLPLFLQKDFIYNIFCIIILLIFGIYILQLTGIWWLK